MALERWLAERQELSGENNHSYSHHHLDSPRILDRSGGLERTRHVLRCIDLLGETSFFGYQHQYNMRVVNEVGSCVLIASFSRNDSFHAWNLNR
jgi:hypothetical protein